MALLTAGERARARAVAEEALVDRCQVARFAQIADGQGGYEPEEYRVIAQDVPCRLSSTDRESSEAGAAGRAGGRVVRLTLTVPWDQDVIVGDRIVWEESWYEVIGIVVGSFRTARRVMVAAVE